MPSIPSVVSLALLALSPLACARPTGTRPLENVKRSRETPKASLPLPNYKDIDASILNRINAMAAAASASAAVKARSLDSVVDVDEIFERSVVKRQSTTNATTTAATCLDSTATDVEINAAFYYGGAGAVVQLCPGAHISITNAIFYTAPNQVLTTQGNPTDDTRALIEVTGSDQSCAIFGPCDQCSGITLRSVQIYGARDKLGWLPQGIGLIEFGGNTKGQVIQDCHIYEPRGWSALHGIEGYQNQCRGMIVKNNQVGPSGYAPNNGNQFKKRQSDPSANVGPGEWADGISMACGASTVTGNTVTDCTDGGIVVFGAEGSTISGNTIVATNRRPLGGINMVDWNPWSGSFTGTVVEGNTLIANTNMMKVGIAIGGMVWGSDNRTAARTFGGTVRNNVFKSGSTGYFGYAVAIAGHQNGNVYGNDASAANFGGDPSSACFPIIPSSQALVYDQWTTPGTQMQNNMQNFPLVFLICQQPGAILASGQVAPDTGMMISGSGPLNASSSASSSAVSSTSSASASASSTVASSSAVSSSAVSSSAVSSSAVSSSAVSSTDVPTSSAVSSSAIVSSSAMVSSSADSSSADSSSVASSTVVSSSAVSSSAAVSSSTVSSSAASSSAASSSAVSSSAVSSSAVSSSATSSSSVVSSSVPASSTSTSSAAAASPSSTLEDLALKATVTASTQTFWSGQTARGANDGVIGGYMPGGSYYNSQEWASLGEKAGAWLTLSWSSVQNFNQLVLWDRPNLADQVLAGNITFADGSGVSFGELPNSAQTGLTINFAQTVSTTSIKVYISKVSSSTKNAGLAELQVYLAPASQLASPAAVTPTKPVQAAAPAAATTTSSSGGLVWSIVKSAAPFIYAPGKDTPKSSSTQPSTTSVVASTTTTSPVWSKVETATATRRVTYKDRQSSNGKRWIIQDGDDVDRLERRGTGSGLVGYSKPTPVAALVNPFATLEKIRREI